MREVLSRSLRLDLSPQNFSFSFKKVATNDRMTTHQLTVLLSISLTFYVQFLCSQVPKVPNDTANLTVIYCTFGICERKSCMQNIDEIEPQKGVGSYAQSLDWFGIYVVYVVVLAGLALPNTYLLSLRNINCPGLFCTSLFLQEVQISTNIFPNIILTFEWSIVS